MGLEQEIGRLADVLEKIEAKMPGGETIVNVDIETPAKSAKKKGKAKTADNVVAESEAITSEEFLKYCNTTLLAIKDVAIRTSKIGKLKEMLKKDYNVVSIKAVPAESAAECKEKFDTIVGE